MVSRWVFLLVAASSNAFAAGNWVLNETADSCTASTAAYFTDRSVYYLDVIADKTGQRPPEVMVRPKVSPSQIPAWRAPIDNSGGFYYFSSLPWANGETQFFYQVPKATGNLVSYLKRADIFSVTSLGPVTGRVKFSLKGSSATLNELERKCGSISDVRFDQKFLSARALALDVAKLTPDIAMNLRGLYFEGFAAYKNIVVVEKELQDLENRYKAMTQELATVRNDISGINSDISSSRQRSVQAQTEIDRANTEIASLRATITGEEARLQVAKSELKQAQDALAPHVAEHDRLANAVASDRRRLDRANQELSSIDSEIEQAHRRIDELEQSLNYLRRQSDKLSRDISQARVELARAENNRLAFNPAREASDRKARDGRLASLSQQIIQADGWIQTQEDNVRESERRLERTIRRLAECEAGGGRERPRREPRRGEGEGDSGRDGDIIIMPADCEAEKVAVEQARTENAAAKQELQRLRNHKQGLIAQKNQIESSIDADVNREYDRLVRNESNARTRVAELQSNLDSNDRQMRNISQIDLPSVRSDLSSLESSRRSALNNVDAAQRALDSSTARYRQFKSSVGWDALKADVAQKTQSVSDIQAGIAQMNRQIAADQKSITDNTALRDRMDRRVVDLSAQLQAKQIREAELVQALVPYDQEKAVVMGKLSAVEAILIEVSGRYDQAIPQ